VSEGATARRYLRHHTAGALSTLSRRLGGYPFGSVSPFVTDHDAQPVILVSRLAEHTKNLDADPRASLLVHDGAPDVQTAGRLTVVADAAPTDVSSIGARYLRYFPDAQRLLDLGDFSFRVLKPVFIRHIAGFGAIRSITAASFAPPEHRLAEIEADILAHMNEDHTDALRAYCLRTLGAAPDAVTMVGIDCDGFDVRADGSLLRFDFDAPVTNASGAREALAAMARGARG
jgi:hypothetical protein